METDLIEAEWALVSDLFDQRGKRGRPADHNRKLMVDACCYVARTGCAWRLLPRNFPPWLAVYRFYKHCAEANRFGAMHDRLRKQWRERVGKAPEPTAAIIDARSTRSTAQGGMVGFDTGKRVKGRKRHLVVDALGLLIAITLTAASIQDRDASPEVVGRAVVKAPGLAKLYADAAYAGRCAQAVESAHPNLKAEIVCHPAKRSTGTPHESQFSLWPTQPSPGFVVQAKRWAVERRHAGNECARRLIAQP